MIDLHNRRAFLRAAAAAGVAWVAADLVPIEEALAWSGQQAASSGSGGFSVLTADQAKVIDAVASRIIPSVDGRPGAHEAGAVYFIDKSLGTFNGAQKKPYADGIADLNRRTTRKGKGVASFAALGAADQDDVLREIEKTPFFQMVRFDTIVGTLGLPALGGNRDYTGWHMLGFEHQPRFQPPFGYYDAAVNRKA